MQWQEIIEFLGGATVFGAVIACLGKSAIDTFLSGRVESYKQELERIAPRSSGAPTARPPGTQAHSSPNALACCNTSSTAASCPSGGYLYFRKIRLTISRNLA